MKSNLLLYSSMLSTTWLLVIFVPCLSEGLDCYFCESNKSWEDCEKEITQVVCIKDHGEVCLKFHAMQNDDSTGKGYKERFVKMCGRAGLCTDKSCKVEGLKCQVHCCHSDLCNTGTPRAANVAITLLGSVVVILLRLLQWC